MTRQEPHVEELFYAALERPAGPERDAFLDGALVHRPDARVRIDALLAAHEEAQGFLEVPLVSAPEASHEPAEVGSRVGPYKLLQVIGEGGMGAVYMAEQESPVRRRVALKVIKLGMDTKQVIARFEAERQALALMDHPSIARVLDAGATDTGRPYFVMELVRGVPIRDYCDTNGVPPRERLEIFVQVCRGIHHAHQKGVIHRDIKPGNVLVTLHDGRPVPKIIDFGVAKATSQRLTERTLFTEFRQFVGTPEYMSPEQAEMSGLDIDTRSDIYSLGVLLYELLTGTTPVDANELRQAGYGEMTRLIREAEPVAPSTRISKLETAELVAKQRGGDARSLERQLQGDLDWIVMKALEKDRGRRYDSAASFADDVLRHLESRPVEAGPPSVLYRWSKFARRNRRGVLVGATFSLLLGLALFFSFLSLLEARREGRRSAEIADSLQDLLGSSDPARAADPDYDAEAVLATSRRVFGADHPTVAATSGALALQLASAGNFEAAEPLYRESLRIWQDVYGSEHLNVAVTRSRLAALHAARGEEDAAEAEWRAALVTFDGLPPGAQLASCEAREGFAALLASRGEQLEAARLLRESIDIRRATGMQRPQVLGALQELMVILVGLGPSEEADRAVREMFEESIEQFPEGTGQHTSAYFARGSWLYQTGRDEEAEPFLRRAVALSREYESTDLPHYLHALDALFQILRGRSDDAAQQEADRTLGELIGLARRFWSDERFLPNLLVYGERLLQHGDYAGSTEAFLRAYPLSHHVGGEGYESERLLAVACIAALGFSADGEASRERATALLSPMRAIQLEERELVRGELVARAGLEWRAGLVHAARASLERALACEDEEGYWNLHELALHAVLSRDDARARASLETLRERLAEREPKVPRMGDLLQEAEAAVRLR